MERLRNQRVKIPNKNVGEGFTFSNIKAYKVTIILLTLDSLVSLERYPHSYFISVVQVGWPHSCCSKALLLCIHPYTPCWVWVPRIQPWVNPGTFWVFLLLGHRLSLLRPVSWGFLPLCHLASLRIWLGIQYRLLFLLLWLIWNLESISLPQTSLSLVELLRNKVHRAEGRAKRQKEAERRNSYDLF